MRRTTYGEWAERVARLAGGCAISGSGAPTGWRPSAGTTTGTWRSTSATALMGASYYTLNITSAATSSPTSSTTPGDSSDRDAELAGAIGTVLRDLDTVEQVLVLDAEGGSGRRSASAPSTATRTWSSARPR